MEQTQTVEKRNYLVGGSFDIDPGVTLTYANETGLYLGNEDAYIDVNSGAVLNTGNDMEIKGGEIGRASCRERV